MQLADKTLTNSNFPKFPLPKFFAIQYLMHGRATEEKSQKTNGKCMQQPYEILK